jgi:pyridoxamine 5'-phosphate oxidase
VFYTNYQSAKSQQLAAAGKASMLFTWLQLHRQVRVVGAVQRAAESTSDEYFASRPRDSQLGAWASAQSQPLDSRHQLEQRVAEVSAQFDGTEVPRPPFWGGWVLQPHRFEFWQGRPSRLHDRVNYTLVDGNWAITRLSP